MNNLNKIFLVVIILLLVSICFMTSAIFKMKSSASTLSHYSQEQTRLEFELHKYMENKLNTANSNEKNQ